jgi:septum site-determining protein MinD
MGRVIAIASGKGGVGKTTLVTNLGITFSKYLNKKTTIVDCNLTNSHLSLYLGMYYSPYTLNDVLKRKVSIEEASYEYASGIYIVPAALSFRNLVSVQSSRLENIARALEKKNDLVILDCSPGLGKESLATMKASDEILLVATPNLPSIMDVARCQEAINKMKKKTLGIVLNMVRGKKYEISAEDVEKFTNLPVLASIPFDPVVQVSLSQGAPLVLWNPKSPAAREIIKLSYLLCGEEFKESIWSKIFSIQFFNRFFY